MQRTTPAGKPTPKPHKTPKTKHHSQHQKKYRETTTNNKNKKATTPHNKPTKENTESHIPTSTQHHRTSLKPPGNNTYQAEHSLSPKDREKRQRTKNRRIAWYTDPPIGFDRGSAVR